MVMGGEGYDSLYTDRNTNLQDLFEQNQEINLD
jgi:hypothetical protein